MFNGSFNSNISFTHILAQWGVFVGQKFLWNLGQAGAFSLINFKAAVINGCCKCPTPLISKIAHLKRTVK